jgi:DNA-binding GntR family transcriptional regulator
MSKKQERTPRRRLDSKGKLIISRLSLHEQVANQLRRMIVSGELAAGEKIRVNELAEQLDVSLTPLREALKVLAGEQLVALLPNRGAIVAPLTVEDTRQLFEAIAGIEAMAAELAAKRITPGQLAELEERHERMRSSFESGDNSQYFEMNREIHDMVVEFAGNPILVQIRSQLAIRAERARFMAVASGTHRLEAMQEHEDLMEALRQGDAKRAHDTWRQHLFHAGQETCRLLEEAAEGADAVQQAAS